MKKIIVASLALLALSLFQQPSFAVEGNITLTAGACQDFVLWNGTDTYSQTICGGWYQFNISKTLGYNETFNISQENISIFAPQNSSAICFIRANISGRLESKGGNCDVEVGIDNLTNYITNYSYYIEPTEKQDIRIADSKNFCSLNITVKGYPEQFRLPSNSTIIPQTQYDLFSKNLEKGLSVVDQAMKCTQDLADEKMKTIFFDGQIKNAKSSTCGIPDSMLLSGWKRLTPYDMDYLRYFVKTTTPLTSMSFTQAITSGKNVTKEQFQSDWFYADQSLKKYSDIGFANITQITYWSPTLNSNTSDYFYTPLVNEYCLNKTSDLLGMEKSASEAGMYGTLFWETLAIAIIFIILYVDAKRIKIFPKF
jgi:hypothetical protein